VHINYSEFLILYITILVDFSLKSKNINGCAFLVNMHVDLDTSSLKGIGDPWNFAPSYHTRGHNHPHNAALRGLIATLLRRRFPSALLTGSVFLDFKPYFGTPVFERAQDVQFSVMGVPFVMPSALNTKGDFTGTTSLARLRHGSEIPTPGFPYGRKSVNPRRVEEYIGHVKWSVLEKPIARILQRGMKTPSIVEYLLSENFGVKSRIPSYTKDTFRMFYEPLDNGIFAMTVHSGGARAILFVPDGPEGLPSSGEIEIEYNSADDRSSLCIDNKGFHLIELHEGANLTVSYDSHGRLTPSSPRILRTRGHCSGQYSFPDHIVPEKVLETTVRRIGEGIPARNLLSSD